MKKCLALFLSIVLLVTSVPVAGFVETKYERNFYIEPYEGADETAYREWAAGLLRYYRDEYLGLKYDGSKYDFGQSNTNFYRLNGGKWDIYSQMFDNCLYHPYYKLAEKKQEFNLSKEANSQYEGKEIASTEYTIYDDDELTGLYMWIIKETISEKARLDPDFFTKDIQGNERYYSFSVKKGTIEYDKELKTLDEKTAADMRENMAQTLISFVDVALNTLVAWDDLKNAGSNAVNEAKAALEGNGQSFGKVLWDKLKPTLISMFTGSLSDGIATAAENVRNQYRNILIDQQTSELLNSMVDCNQNVINYLESTYLENPMAVMDEKFIGVVNTVVTTLKSAAFDEALQAGAQNRINSVRAQLTSQLDLQLADVLSTAEMWQVIGYKIADNILEGVCDMLNTVAGTGLETLKTKYKDKKPLGKILENSQQSVENIVKNVVERLKKALDTVIADWIDQVKNNKTISEEAENASNPFDKAFDGLGWEIVDEIAELILNNVDSAIPMKDKNNKEATAEEAKENGERLLSIANYFFDDTASFQDKDTIFNGLRKPIGVALLTIAKEIVKSMGTHLGMGTSNVAAGVSLPPKTKSELEDNFKRISELIGDFEPIIKNGGLNGFTGDKAQKPIFKMVKDMTIEMENLILAIVAIIDEDSGSEVSKALANVLKDVLSPSTLLSAVKVGFTDVDLAQMFTEVFVGTAESDMKNALDPDEQLFKDLIGNCPEYVEKIYNKIANSANAAFEGVVDVVSNVWDSMMDCSATLAKACESVSRQLTGEHLASLEAERALQTRNQSYDLEVMLMQNAINTIPRYTYYNKSYSDYDKFLSSGNVAETRVAEHNLFYNMTVEDITYQVDGEWVVVPDINAVKVLADYILTQMHLDCVGMGAYLSVLKKRTEYKDTNLYKEYLNEGVLCAENQAQLRYGLIQEAITKFESQRPPFPSASETK